jgi:hypothetical protein
MPPVSRDTEKLSSKSSLKSSTSREERAGNHGDERHGEGAGSVNVSLTAVTTPRGAIVEPARS